MIQEDRKIEKYLNSGLSGCYLEISNQGKTVIKKSPGTFYDNRLLLQANKQKEFHKFKISNIKCPDITYINSEKSPFSFEMSYVSGIRYDDFLNYSNPSSIDNFISSLIDYIDILIHSTEKYYPLESFTSKCMEKIDSIEDKVDDILFVRYLKNRIKNCKDAYIPETFCHGDLTMSNILFSSDSIYFIDLLDSYIESWLIDIIKLKQDLYYFWSLSRTPESKNMRSIQTSLHIWHKINLKYSDFTNSDGFKILEALNFLRIYPYIKEASEKNILENIIKKLPIYEEFNSANGR
jgi:hypothetical protein